MDHGRTRPAAVKTSGLQEYDSLWEELRVGGEVPDRRSYHSACDWQGKLFIYGGQDLREGVFKDMWVLTMDPGYGDEDSWEKIPGDDMAPNMLCRHSAVVYQNRMYIFGGTDNFTENNTTFCFDLMAKNWLRYPAESPQLPPKIDSHSAIVYDDTEGNAQMLIFGGYIAGSRTNSCYQFNISTKGWSQMTTNGNPPTPRNDHSASLHENCMYVFGGLTNQARIGDFWQLNLRNCQWTQITDAGVPPTPRSGHSSVVYKNALLVFGGMNEITKESNELYSYNFSKQNWNQIQNKHHVSDPVSSQQVEEYKAAKGRSPFRINTVQSPTKVPSAGEEPNSANKETPSPTKTKGKRMLYDGPVSPEKGRVAGHVPHARDGHSAVVIDKMMILFGGDRHQMPFNDIYMYSINEEVISSGGI